MRARYYDPSTEQFVSVDPLTAVTEERYGYAAGNPLDTTDPRGLCTVGSISIPLGGSEPCSDDAGSVATTIASHCGAASAVTGTGALVAAVAGAELAAAVLATASEAAAACATVYDSRQGNYAAAAIDTAGLVPGGAAVGGAWQAASGYRAAVTGMNAVADAGEAGAANGVITAFRAQVFPAVAQKMAGDYRSVLYGGSAVVFGETGTYAACE